MASLSAKEIQHALESLPDWLKKGRTIHRTYEFADFAVAMKFVNKVAWTAEKVAHHPDIDIRWNKVTLSLTTHDDGGLTAKDFGLAAKCDRLSVQVRAITRTE
jgi:4a-hydroxytetrahydrobiopterin dehydratase